MTSASDKTAWRTIRVRPKSATCSASFISTAGGRSRDGELGMGGASVPQQVKGASPLPSLGEVAASRWDLTNNSYTYTLKAYYS